jgi:hypothetical protein
MKSKCPCRQFEEAISALKVIWAWAKCHADYGTLDPEHVMALCEKTIKDYETWKGV